MIQVAPIFLCGVGCMSMRQALIKNPSLTTNLFSLFLLKSIVYKPFLTFIACYLSLPINFYGCISVCVSSIFIHSSGSDELDSTLCQALRKQPNTQSHILKELVVWEVTSDNYNAL